MASRKNARRWSREDVLNLDSLVDVVTNTNGMLILLAVFTTIMAMGKTYEAFYPMARATEKTPVFFECQANRIVLLKKGGELGEHYRPLFFDRGLALIREEGEWGETDQEIQRPESEFRQIVAAMDSAKEYPFFFVRPDSFGIFRAAREVLWENQTGMNVGWEPFAEDAIIVFSSDGGREPTSQYGG